MRDQFLTASASDVRCGSTTVLTAPKRDFRSTPNNGQSQTDLVGPFGANKRSRRTLFDYLVGERLQSGRHG